MPVALAAAALAGGCGLDDDGAEKPTLETTDSGTRIITVTDRKAGLEMEIQDDSLYVKTIKDAPPSTRDLLGASCEDDGKQGVDASAQFPVYWREDSSDWGSALARDDNLGRVEVYESQTIMTRSRRSPSRPST